MKSGKTCGYKDGHRSKCVSVAAYEKHKAYWRQWNDDNPDYRSQWKDKNPGYNTIAHRRAISVYGNSCNCCGSREDLSIDHVLGGGTDHMATFSSNQKFYEWLTANTPMGFQVLCRRCNSSKADTPNCRLHPHNTSMPKLNRMTPVSCSR